jgi:hypothetical protein
LVGDEDFRYQGKLILDLGGLLMEAATVALRPGAAKAIARKLRELSSTDSMSAG